MNNDTRLEDIKSRILKGESYSSIARDLGVSRQRIHQLAQKLGVAFEDSITPYLEEVISRREAWETPKQIFGSLHFTQSRFERVLEEHPSLLERWEAAQQLPTTRNSAQVNPYGRVCISCPDGQIKPWSEFHRGTGPNNRNSQCKSCAIKRARDYYLTNGSSKKIIAHPVST